jgi:hypothetical protein
MQRRTRLTCAARLCGLTFSVFLLTLTCPAVARAQAGRSATRTWVSAAAGSSTNPCTRDAPCRDLASAVAAVAEDGEVVIIDSGSYDAVEITKSVQVVAPEGVHAVIAPTTGLAVPGDPDGMTAAVLINAPGARVALRNLNVNTVGAVTNAIRAAAVGSLHVENCVLNNVNDSPHEDFGDIGLFFTTGGRLTVRDTTVRNHGSGIYVFGPPGGAAAHASIDRCRLDGNTAGLIVYSNARVAVSNTVAAHGSSSGFFVNTSPGGPPAELSCDNCAASGFATGFSTGGSAGAVIRVARSTATSNNYGFFNQGTSQFKSLAGTNMVDGNVQNFYGSILSAVSGQK